MWRGAAGPGKRHRQQRTVLFLRGAVDKLVAGNKAAFS
jgi:hypothetical protein